MLYDAYGFLDIACCSYITLELVRVVKYTQMLKISHYYLQKIDK